VHYNKDSERVWNSEEVGTGL